MGVFTSSDDIDIQILIDNDYKVVCGKYYIKRAYIKESSKDWSVIQITYDVNEDIMIVIKTLYGAIISKVIINNPNKLDLMALENQYFR